MLLLASVMWGPAVYSAAMSAGSRAAASLDRGARFPSEEYGFYMSNSMLIDEPPFPSDWPDTGAMRASEYEHVEFTVKHAAAMDERYREAAEPGQCLFELANREASGKSGEVCKVPSKLYSAKDGSAHEWQVGAEFQCKNEFAAMMDSNPEWYAWGLKDLRPVKGTEYSISLTDTRPVFAKQYHLAHRESEFAEAWVKELEDAGLAAE